MWQDIISGPNNAVNGYLNVFNITQLGSGFKDPGLCQDVKHAAPGKKEIIKIKNK